MNEVEYDELLKKRIGEALRNQRNEEKLNLATLEQWVEEDRQRRKLKNRLKRMFGFLKR